jgi:hypothetical protein
MPKELSTWRDTAPGMASTELRLTWREQSQKRHDVTVEEGWPAAAAVELCAALVKRRLTSRAGIDSGRLVAFVLPRPRSLGAFQAYHPELHACIRRSRMLISHDGMRDAPARE